LVLALFSCKKDDASSQLPDGSKFAFESHFGDFEDKASEVWIIE